MLLLAAVGGGPALANTAAPSATASARTTQARTTPTASAVESAAPLGLTVEAPADRLALGQAVELRAAVTNGTGRTCALATTPETAVRIAGVSRDGSPVAPALAHAYYGSGVLGALGVSLVTTAAGDVVEVTLRSRALERDGVPVPVLHDVEPLPTQDGIVSSWALDAPGRYEVALRYEVPGVAHEPAVCPGSSPVRTVAFTIDDHAGQTSEPDGTGDAVGPSWWLVLGLLVLAGGVTAVVLVRRRGRGATATVAALVLAGGWVLAAPAPAQARYIVNGTDAPPGFAAAVARCMTELRDPSRSTPETRRILDWAADPSTPLIQIVWGDNPSTVPPPDPGGTIDPADGRSMVIWTPTPPGSHGPGIPTDPCTELLHELAHAMRMGQGADRSDWMCGDTGIRTEEVMATFIENAVRVARGLPPRTHYGTDPPLPLPASLDECGPEPPRPEVPPGPVRYHCNPSACAESNGDPHLTTFDGVRFSPQAVGELVLLETDDGMAVQARQSPLGPSRRVSVNTAVAAQVGAHRVTLTLADGAIVTRVDGEVRTLVRGEHPLPDGGTVWRGPSARTWAQDSVRIGWPDGSWVRADPIGAAGLRLHLSLAAERHGAVRGLLGDADGSGVDDLVTRDGTVMAMPLTRAALYDELVGSWRVSAAESLFDYLDGESTETVTDLTFPDEVVTVGSLDRGARERAEAVCRLAGVTSAAALDTCALDVAVSGLPAFAVAAGEAQRDLDRGTGDAGGAVGRVAFRDATTVTPLVGERVVVNLAEPGAVGQVTFAATAGQVVVVDLTGGTLPDGCGQVRLLGPDGTALRTGCLDDGAGLLDRTVLAQDGTHTIVVDPSGTGVGEVTLRLVAVTDDEVEATVDGPAVDVTLAVPGAHGRVLVEAAAGRRVAVEVTPTVRGRPLPSGCGQVRLLDPAGVVVRAGCLTDGRGGIPGLELTGSGRYTVLIDPSGSDVGAARVRVVATP